MFFSSRGISHKQHRSRTWNNVILHRKVLEQLKFAIYNTLCLLAWISPLLKIYFWVTCSEFLSLEIIYHLSRNNSFLPLRIFRCYPISLAEKQEWQQVLLIGQKRSGKSIAGIYGRERGGKSGEREHEHFIPWMRLGSLYRPFTPWLLEVLTGTDDFAWNGGCGREGLVTAHVSAPDLLQIEKPLLWLLLGWLRGKSLSPDIQFILFLTLFDIYQQHNVWPTQMYKKASFSSACPSQREAVYSISQTRILLRFFLVFWYQPLADTA